VSQTPERIGKYSIIRELGRGSFATVYLALEPDATRPVALKLLRNSSKDQEVLARFDREGEIGARLQHPGIVPVLDHGLDTRGPYLVLEFQEGGSLADRLARGSLSSEEAAEVVVAVARAVHAAHRQGVIHRDLKPANILFDGLGNPRVTDFGLAHDDESVEAMTRTGDVLGTPFYMAPEQISGEGVLDAQTDVYSLGVILYESLTGRRPYTTRRLDELVRLVVAGSPAPLGPGISPPVRGVCRKAMSPDRSERYASAEAMADALELAILPPAPPPNHLLRGALLLILGALAITAAALVVPTGGELPEATGDETQRAAPSWSRLKALAESDHPLDAVAGQLEQAIEDAQEDPELEGRVRRLLALSLWRQGRLQRAATAAGEGSRLQRYLRARIAAIYGDAVEAKRLYVELEFGEDPVARLAAVARRLLAYDAKGAEEVAGWLDEGELGLFRAEVALQRAQLALLRGDHGAARLRLKASLEHQPRDVHALYTLSITAQLEDDRLGQIELLDRALAVCGDDAPVFLLVHRATAAVQIGDEAGARELVERAGAQSPGDWAVQFLRAHLAALAQNTHDATRLFSKAAANCPRTEAFVGRALSLPEEIGVQALKAGGYSDQIPALRARASVRRRAEAVGGNSILIALGFVLDGHPIEQIELLFKQARSDCRDRAALAWEEALFYVGRDLYDRAGEAIEQARAAGFDADRLQLLEGSLKSRQSLQDEQFRALEAVAADGHGVARDIAFAELAGYGDNFEAAKRHVSRALELAPDDPLAWEAWLKAGLPSSGNASGPEQEELAARLEEARARFGLSWVSFLELEVQVEFFRHVSRDESREGWRRAVERLTADVREIARLCPQSPRALLMAVDMMLLRPSNDVREEALGMLAEAERRALPHQRHEILLTMGYVELTRPKREVVKERVLGLWRKALEIQPKSQIKANWAQLYRFRFGKDALQDLEPFGEDFVPDLDDQPPPPK